VGCQRQLSLSDSWFASASRAAVQGDNYGEISQRFCDYHYMMPDAAAGCALEMERALYGQYYATGMLTVVALVLPRDFNRCAGVCFTLFYAALWAIALFSPPLDARVASARVSSRSYVLPAYVGNGAVSTQPVAVALSLEIMGRQASLLFHRNSDPIESARHFLFSNGAPLLDGDVTMIARAIVTQAASTSDLHTIKRSVRLPRGTDAPSGCVGCVVVALAVSVYEGASFASFVQRSCHNVRVRAARRD
jgi:hypothetical protein